MGSHFKKRRTPTQRSAFVNTMRLIYVQTVFQARGSYSSAMMSLVMNMVQAMILVAVFYTMFTVLGMKGAALRGDFLLYIMSGVFMFMVHTRAMQAVAKSPGPSSPVMLHAPINTIITMSGAAFSALYSQLLTLIFAITVYHCVASEIYIYDPFNAFLMVILSWFTGVAVGVLFYSLTPWAPKLMNVMTPLYMRANMLASGKMFVANTLPGSMLAMFDWNPLFHTIDQLRGYTFINYVPRNTSAEYALYVAVTLLVVGMMIEYMSRKNVSASWEAKG